MKAKVGDTVVLEGVVEKSSNYSWNLGKTTYFLRLNGSDLRVAVLEDWIKEVIQTPIVPAVGQIWASCGDVSTSKIMKIVFCDDEHVLLKECRTPSSKHLCHKNSFKSLYEFVEEGG